MATITVPTLEEIENGNDGQASLREARCELTVIKQDYV